ncbi:MAG: hypothetical protein DRN08_04240, partial [Thermoplasmata archaeon]
GWNWDHFSNIQKAINATAENGTIYVYNGTYIQQNTIIINKKVEITGENQNNTIIYTPGIMIAYADNVYIHGFTINSTEGVGIYIAGNYTRVDNNKIFLINVAGTGISVEEGSNNNIISHNIIKINKDGVNTPTGIAIIYSCNNIVSGNNLSNGIELIESINNTINNNILKSDGITIEGSTLPYWSTHTIENNYINNKPIYYYKNIKNYTIPTDAGQVLIANCSNITIQNLNLNLVNTSYGIQIGFTTHSSISKNNITIPINNVAQREETGIILYHSSNNSVSRNKINNTYYGIRLSSSSYNTISENIIKNTHRGIYISTTSSSNNTISDNNFISNALYSIQIYGTNNSIYRNIISNCTGTGIMSGGVSNHIYHNNFINNTVDAYDFGQDNQWDNGYPAGGNYWDDHTGPDNYHGPNQNIPGSDGIIDTPRNIPNNAQDRYPLATPNTHILFVNSNNTQGPWDGTIEHPYQHIQQAIDNATNGALIYVYVYPGTYYENIHINKTLTITGLDKNNTTIRGTLRIWNSTYVAIQNFTIETGYKHNIIIINSSYIEIYNNTIKNTIKNILSDNTGIHIISSININITKNEIHNLSNGILIKESEYIQIKYNLIHDNTPLYQTQNSSGIILLNHTTNTYITDNNITNNYIGIAIHPNSINNTIYHNNFINNTKNAINEEGNNQWNKSYPYCGNYWSDYDEPEEGAYDEYTGCYQNIPGSDGIIDKPYKIPNNAQDNYPLLKPWNGTLKTPPNRVYVDDDYTPNTPGWNWDHFSNIQKAINATAENGTIYVYNGSYHENIIINRSINIIGEDKNNTIINGNSYMLPTIKILAPTVNISGFTIQNNLYSEKIKIISNNNTIHNNIIICNQNTPGIFLYYSSNNKIYKNDIISSYDVTGEEKGILLIESDNNSIENNHITNTSIFISRSCNNTISNNTIQQHNIILNDRSHNNKLFRNIITSENTKGYIELKNSPNNTIIHNNISKGINIYFTSNTLPLWCSYIIKNNTDQEGNPICYYKNTNDFVVPSEASQIILANCSNFMIQNLSINNMNDGIEIAFSHHGQIHKNRFTHNQNSINVI